MIVEFTYYLHDTAESSELREHIDREIWPLTVDDDLMGKIGRPFYEITLKCTLDTETGAIAIVKVT